MKKLTAILMALLLLVSSVTVCFSAFAADGQETTAAEDTTAAVDEEEGGFSLEDLEDLPLWKVKIGAKFLLFVAKFALKIGKFLIKFGIIDKSTVANFVSGIIGNIKDDDKADETNGEGQVDNDQNPAVEAEA